MYFFLGSLAYALGDPLTIVLMIVMMFIRDAKRAALIGVGGTIAIVAFTVVTVGSGPGGRMLPLEYIIAKTIGTVLWVAIGWGIGHVVRRLLFKGKAARAADGAASQPSSLSSSSLSPASRATAMRDAFGAPVESAPDGDLAAQVILVRQALASGRRLRALAASDAGAAPAIDRAIAELEQARDALAATKLPYQGEALQRLQAVVAELDAQLKQRGAR